MNFDKFYAEKIALILYWCSIIFVILLGCMQLYNPFGRTSFYSILIGTTIIFGGVLSIRLSFEAIIVLFRINSNLTSIKEQNKEKIQLLKEQNKEK
ncbi:hypothetical protein CRV00_01030 [Malaciobacter molluscorum]|uniref:DUF4282 domain-containing protein n=1 Tax=Malaciobacter molluscorum TaxID=1032072 RepID=UPI00100B9E0D|nr:DUF4282 domain-containing protein [Malaciobacter molluscorum]RXJ97447.1 hypothetical protein CRV00_01030 [Malaciobacter molluscorum]